MESVETLLNDEPVTAVEVPKDESKDTPPKEDAAPSAAPEKTEIVEKVVEAKPEKAPAVGHLAALMAERNKRQAAEARLAELEKAKPDKPDYFAEPDKAIEQKVSELVTPIREKFFKQSIRLAETAHADFEQAVNAFEKRLEADPSLRERWIADEDPGEFIYSQWASSPEAQEKQAAERTAALAAKDAEIATLRAELENVKQASPNLPESLNRQPSGALPRTEEDEDDPKSIVRFKPNG